MSRNGPAAANRTGKATANDVVMTCPKMAEWIVSTLPIQGTTLDPAKGEGAFFDALPGPKQYCEISEGRDFLEFKGQVDWIVTNPPYSIYYEFLEKAFEVSDNVAFLVPMAKTTTSDKIRRLVQKYGGIRRIHFMAGGGRFGFPFGFLTGVVWYQRGYEGWCEILHDEPPRLIQDEPRQEKPVDAEREG